LSMVLGPSIVAKMNSLHTGMAYLTLRSDRSCLKNLFSLTRS
jgi:hypothetical protein